MIIFFCALLILLAFFWYFSTENPLTKTWLGTLITVALVAFCLFGAVPPADKLKKGIDLAGGSSFVLEIRPPAGKELSNTAITRAKEVIRERLNARGTADLQIVERGDNQLVVQMPGIAPEERNEIRQTLEKAAQLNFHLVHPQNDQLAQAVADGDEYIAGYKLKMMENLDKNGQVESESPLLITRYPDLAGTYVKSANGGFIPGQGAMVFLSFNNEGTEKFFNLTRENVGERLAIVVDGEVISAPSLRTAIAGGSAQIDGMASEKEAKDLAAALENPLEEPMEIIDERSVSPTLGADSVRQGVYAGFAGLALTLVFVALYYRLPGMIAIFGLAVNIVILFGVMGMFQFAFTMPGIAGIVLTIGMAVDANVLIYERLKEERAAGKSIGAAIDAAYEKAFSAIFDANITTLITASLLYFMATDAVRGFAITLIVGILASLFASLVVTRVCFRWLMTANLLEKISIGSKIRIPMFDFMGKRKIALVVSISAIIICLAEFAYEGENALGIDFKGGDEIEFKLPEGTDVTVPQIEASIAALEINASVQEQTDAGGSGTFITVRGPEGTAISALDDEGNIVKKGIIDQLRADIPALAETTAEGGYAITESVQSVGPSMGKALLTESALALGIGLIAIMIFISVRYEFSFAVGALFALVHDMIIAAGIAVLLNVEMSVIQVGAFLTIAGYSINDTIVVFDRVRETLTLKKGNVRDIVNVALNATLSRTLLTSGTTMATLLTLSIFGGPGMRDFSMTILIGIIIGTYSSVFVAAPVTVWWSNLRGKSLRREVLDAEAAKAAAMASPAAPQQ